MNSHASTVAPRILHGPLCHSVSTSALIARPTTVISVSTSPLFDPRISTVRTQPEVAILSTSEPLDTCVWTNIWDIEWQWEQLRVMKVGGNESATKYFQTHGGSAALASKDSKVKYTSNAAVKYKEELKRRAAADAQQ